MFSVKSVSLLSLNFESIHQQPSLHCVPSIDKCLHCLTSCCCRSPSPSTQLCSVHPYECHQEQPSSVSLRFDLEGPLLWERLTASFIPETVLCWFLSYPPSWPSSLMTPSWVL